MITLWTLAIAILCIVWAAGMGWALMQVDSGTWWQRGVLIVLWPVLVVALWGSS